MVTPGRAAPLSDATWDWALHFYTMPTITFFYLNVIKETALFCCTLWLKRLEAMTPSSFTRHCKDAFYFWKNKKTVKNLNYG